jgi:hypothetical protein
MHAHEDVSPPDPASFQGLRSAGVATFRNWSTTGAAIIEIDAPLLAVRLRWVNVGYRASVSLQCGCTTFSRPGIAPVGQLSAPASVSERLTSGVRISELPAQDRPFRSALEGRQCEASFGNSSTRDRPGTGAHRFHRAAIGATADLRDLSLTKPHNYATVVIHRVQKAVVHQRLHLIAAYLAPDPASRAAYASGKSAGG